MNKLVTPLVLALILMLGTETISAQTWAPVGSGIPGNWKFYETDIKSTTANGLLYVAYYNDPFPAPLSAMVQSWNGLSWTTYPAVPSTDFYISDIAVSGQTIYLTGYDISGVAFYEFDGSNWIAHTPPGYSGETRTAEIINGDLVIGGDFTATGFSDLFRFSGGSYGAYPPTPASLTSIRDIHEFNGELFISGEGGSWTGPPHGLIKLNNGTNWVQPANFYQGTTTTRNDFSMFTYQGDLFVGDDSHASSILRLGNDTLHYEGNLDHSFSDFAEVNGIGYLVGDTSYNGSPNRITRFDGNSLVPILGAPSALSAAESYQSELVIFSLTGTTLNGITYNHVFRTQANFALLSGETFSDVNSDCFRNSNEIAVPHALVSVGGQVFTSDASGQYSVGLSPGTYSFDTIYSPLKAWKNASVSCPLPNNITLGANSSVVQNIGFTNLVNTDLLTTFNGYRGWRAVYGFTEIYQLAVSNAGIATFPSTSVTVDVPPSLTFISSNPAPSSVTGNSYTYNLMNIQPLENRIIRLEVNIDTSSNSLGDSLIWKAYLDAVPGDADLTDNADTLGQTVTGAYDPNDKQASASEILPGTQTIDYHIKFQNTGTDTAYKVTVVDTLDMALPVTHIVINSASHPFNFIVQNNILVWEFDNIMLPDSGADYAGSQGYVRFSAGINPGLGVGDTIDNDAEIYFDYQKPVHTNHAKTAVVAWISLPEVSREQLNIEMFPNPAKDELHIINNENEALEFQLINSAGVVVDKIIALPESKTTIAVHSLSPGLYLLKNEFSTYKLIVGQ